LDKILQTCSELVESIYRELVELVKVWPELPEHIKETIKSTRPDTLSNRCQMAVSELELMKKRVLTTTIGPAIWIKSNGRKSRQKAERLLSAGDSGG
jgi:hypothetical protein